MPSCPIAQAAEEGPGYGVSQHAAGLPLGMVPDDLAWMAQVVAYTCQALLYAQQWSLVVSVGDRAHNLFPLHLMDPVDKRDPDAASPSLLWSAAEVGYPSQRLITVQCYMLITGHICAHSQCLPPTPPPPPLLPPSPPPVQVPVGLPMLPPGQEQSRRLDAIAAAMKKIVDPVGATCCPLTPRSWQATHCVQRQCFVHVLFCFACQVRGLLGMPWQVSCPWPATPPSSCGPERSESWPVRRTI